MRWGKVLLVLFLLSSFAAAQESDLKVRSVHIRSLGVFDPSHKDFQWWPFRLLNRLHWKTQDSFIRGELLLKEGEVYMPDLVRESERNLRRYNFLTDVSIRAERVNFDEVDLFVNTEDQWTTKPIFSFGTSRGARSIDLGLEEENFLGLGKTVGFRYEQDSEREGISGNYADPALLNTRMRLNLKLSDFSDGHRGYISLIQPFYSQNSKWSYGAEFDDLRTSQHLYHQGVDAAEIEEDRHIAGLSLARAWGPRYRKLRVGMSAGYQELLYPSTVILDPDAASHEQIQQNLYPEGKRLLNIGIGVDQDFQKFTRFLYIDNFGRVEDLPVGFQIGMSVFHSRDQKGPDFATGNFHGRLAQQKDGAHYFVSEGDFSIRRQEGGWNNYITNLFAHYYLQKRPANFVFFQFPQQTIATNLSATLTNDVDAPFQLSLGENEGLRGYSFKSLTGLNRLLLNLEDRVLLPWENRLLAFGIVPFVDAGYVWGGSEKEFGTSIGIGLRLGFKKYRRTKVWRIDFAFPLTKTKGNGLSVSVANGQIFKIL